MITIRTFSREKVVGVDVSDRYVISISDIQPPPAFLTKPLSLLALTFCDDEEDFNSTYSPLDARHILDFAQEALQQDKDLIVHCHAGISRSVAVALAIKDLLGPESVQKVLYDGMLEINSSTYSLYNKHVYSTLRKVSYSDLYGD